MLILSIPCRVHSPPLMRPGTTSATHSPTHIRILQYTQTYSHNRATSQLLDRPLHSPSQTTFPTCPPKVMLVVVQHHHQCSKLYEAGSPKCENCRGEAVHISIVQLQRLCVFLVQRISSTLFQSVSLCKVTTQNISDDTQNISD